MDAGPFGQFNVLIQKCYRKKSWGLLTKMHERMESMSSTIDSVHRPLRKYMWALMA